MKTFAILLSLLLSITSFAGSYQYDETLEINKTLERFDRCGDANESDYEQFRNLVDLLDVQRENNRKPTVEITEDSYYLVSVRDNTTMKSCDLVIYPHDERCVRAECE